MGFNVKIALKNDNLSADSTDLLKDVKNDSTTKSLLQIQPFQIQTAINLAEAELSTEKKTAAMKAAQKEGDQIQKELEERVEKLVKRIKELQAKDKIGDAKAGDEAQKETKTCSDDVDEALPDFGRRIRKAVEKGTGAKLSASCKSVSSGQFRGIKLIAKFEHAGASAEVAKDYREAAKSLEKAQTMIAEDVKEEKKTVDALQASVQKTIKEVSPVASKNDPVQVDKLNGEIASTSESFSKSAELYVKNVGDFATLLRKTHEAFNKEAAELKDDLDDKMKEKKLKLNQVGTQLTDLQTAVTARLADSKKVVQQFTAAGKLAAEKKATAAEKTTAVKLWKEQLDSISGQLAKLSPIDTANFNKALQNMAAEAKKNT